jgi:hypothetical protein
LIAVMGPRSARTTSIDLFRSDLLTRTTQYDPVRPISPIATQIKPGLESTYLNLA